MASLGQSVAQTRDDQTAHNTGIAEPNLGFCRMDVDVDQRGVTVNEQRGDRVAIPRQHVHVPGAQSAQQQSVHAPGDHLRTGIAQ